MKTKFFLFASSIIFSGLAVPAQKNVHFGVKAGANFSTITSEGASSTGSKTGFHAGGLAHIHLNKSWAIQPELVYSLRGGKNNLPGGATQSINLNYINVPILLQYMFDNGFRLQTGPQVGFLVNANYKTGNVKTTVTNLYNSTDFAWGFGASYLSNVGLGIDARYNLGLTDVYKPGNGKQANNVFQLGLFYMFKHRSK